MRRVIQIPINDRSPYECQIYDALSELPHGYKKRLIMNLLKATFPDGESSESIKQRMLSIADVGLDGILSEAISQHAADVLPIHGTTRSDENAPASIRSGKENEEARVPSLLRGPTGDT